MVLVGSVGEPAEPPASTPTVVAQVIYAGSHHAFMECAPQRIPGPTILLFADLIFALIAIGVGASLLL